MPVTCLICQKQFLKQITNSHLKTHNLTTADYKLQYGVDSLSCPEYRAERSSANSGQNNPHYGKKHSEKTKKTLSKKLKGRPAHNKGKKLADDKKQALLEGIARREQTYKENDYHPRKGAVLSETTKNVISKKLQEYAKNNPEKIKESVAKATAKKSQPGGYFEKVKEETRQTRIQQLDLWGFDLTLYSDEFLEICCRTCGTKSRRITWGYCHANMCPTCHPRPSTSKEEKELQEWLAELYGVDRIIFNDKSVFSNGFEIDVHIPDLNLGIEYNGLWWHSELQGKSKHYHITKHKKAKEKGIHLIQIFEDEWQYKKEICKDRLKQKLGLCNTRVYARNCSISVLERKNAFSFLEKYHIQGKGYGDHFFGLEFNNSIIAVMSFAPLTRAKGFKKNEEGVFELNRFASIGNVIGGASKLFKHFLKLHLPKTILSYSDLRWNTGNLYEVLGFNFVGNTMPGYWYVKGDRRYHRFSLRKNENDDPNLTEWENRKNQGWNRIWDCGHAKYEWKSL
jgi:hypothetical protein